jgi:hypothetical protein
MIVREKSEKTGGCATLVTSYIQPYLANWWSARL